MQHTNYSLEQVCYNLGIEALNEMQLATLDSSRENNNILLLSATGTGKTLAFLLPVLEQLRQDLRSTQAMIIVPSRELAIQIEKVFKMLGSRFKVTLCYGGHLRETEENNLIEAPALIIGTPGRIADHIRRGNITTGTINMLVLDEFDKSLELGFQEEMEEIINALPAVSKRLLVSATESVSVPGFIGFSAPALLNFLPEHSDGAARLDIRTVSSPMADKLDTLFRLICFLGGRSTIIFCNHRESVERTSSMLKEQGIINEFYHGAMEQRERDSALCKFRNGSTHILVTTDIAARGLDIPNIRYIIHYHLPHTEDIFTHRNGRTARMDASGTAILLLGPEESLPDYLEASVPELVLPDTYSLPEKPKWSTLFVAAGKKNKVNKVDILGFLAQKGELKKEDIGIIEVKDFSSFVAVRKSKVGYALHLIKEHRLKGKKVRIELAK